MPGMRNCPGLLGCNFIPSNAINQLEQTIYAWDTPGGDAEPEPWFDDLLRADGTPYRAEEVALFRRHAAQEAG